MEAPTLDPVLRPGREQKSRAPSLRSIVRKSGLLNLVIVLTSFPVFVVAGGVKAVLPALALMAGLSFVIWTATFTMFSLISLIWIFRPPASSAKMRDPRHLAHGVGLADRWLDGPI